MHIPDNYLSPQTDAVMAVAMVPVWVHCIKKVRATLDREHMAFLGICAAFSFLLMMFNVPLPGGTTGHAVGGALIALLLGPEAATIAVSVALALQALLFGDGGILSFGANCFNMAFVLPFVAAIVFRALSSRLHDKSWGTSVSAIVSGWIGLCVAALCAAIEFGIQPMLFTNASGAPLYCLGLGVALLLGSLYVYFRDVAHIWEVVLQAMFYATPIIYPISMVAQNKEFSWAADILMLNPTTQTIMDIRHNLLSPEYVPTVWTMVDNKLLCLLPYVLSAVILWLGIHVFRKYSAKFAEVL